MIGKPEWSGEVSVQGSYGGMTKGERNTTVQAGGELLEPEKITFCSAWG